MDDLSTLVSAYVNSRRELLAMSNRLFPRNSAVWLEGPKIYGIVMGRGDCPEDRLPVLVENGNVWWYQLCAVRPEPDVRKWPRWIRDAELRWKLTELNTREVRL